MRRIIGLTLTIALGLTALVAVPAGAIGSASDCTVNGGLNWEWSFGADGGTNYLQVNARLDKDGQPTGVIHWRQTRNEDQNFINLRADVHTIYQVGPSAVYLVATIRNGVTGGDAKPNIWVGLQDNGEPGTEDGAWVKYYTGGSLPFNTAPKNGNIQVSCEVPV